MKQPESAIQRAVIEHIRVRGQPDMLWWHTPNSGKRSRLSAAILKGLGVRPGVADLLFLRDGKFYSLELKARWHSTDAQMEWHDKVFACGGLAAIVVGIDPALKKLEEWSLLRVAKS